MQSMIEHDNSSTNLHIPVLLKEVCSFVDLSLPSDRNFRFLDGTLGLGGHAKAILSFFEQNNIKNISYLGLDRDANAMSLAKLNLEKYNDQMIYRHSKFSDSLDVLEELGWDEIDFALIDIGVSSLQLDTPDRGFSFNHEGPLDMRMDSSNGKTAMHLVNKASVNHLRTIIKDYGEEPMAAKIAKAIDDARSKKEITSTLELAKIVSDAYPKAWRAKSRNHPATRTFQALRIEVNEELEELKSFLSKVSSKLSQGGRLAVITFHSLEDRIVKHFFKDLSSGCICPPHIPVCVCGKVPLFTILTKKPITASSEELAVNSRSKSAKLRVVERLFV